MLAYLRGNGQSQFCRETGKMALPNMDYLLLCLYELHQIFEEYRIPHEERARLLYYRRRYRDQASCER